MEQEVNNKITLDYEDGSTCECEILGVFEANGAEYIALYPEDSEDIILYRYIENGENFELEDIPEELEDEDQVNKMIIGSDICDRQTEEDSQSTIYIFNIS